MKKLLPFLFVCLLASCQLHSLRLTEDKILTEDEIKDTSLQDLLTKQNLNEGQVKEEMGKFEGRLLRHAAEKGWLSVVHKLLLQGVDVDSKDNLGNTPLHYAAESEYGHTALAGLLLEKGAQVNSKTNASYTPLHKAAVNGHTALAGLLLEEGAQVNSKDKRGYTPLHWAAYRGNTALASLLLEKGAQVNSKTNYGYTSLHYAAEYGHTALAGLLLEKGAQVNSKTNKDETPLHWAARYGHTETAAFLRLAEGKSKVWLKAYYEGFSYKEQHEKDKKKLHTYARVYAELYEEDPDGASRAMPYYFQYLKEGSSHQEAKKGAILMAHCL